MPWAVQKGKISNFAAYYYDIFIMSLSFHNPMRFLYTHLIIYILAIAFALPFDAAARKKETDGKGMAAYAAIEPDAQPQKAKREKTVTRALALDQPSSAKVNTRYREGIDVSHYQGMIDWDALMEETPISYVYIKATEGAALVDDTYAYNLREARRVGLSAGSYHFYRPNVDWKTQLENLTSTVLREDQDLVPIIDIEHRGNVSYEKFIADLSAFVREVTKHYGKKPLLYTFQNFYNKYLCGTFKDYHWMIARYRPDEPTLDDSRKYIIWQYTAKGSVSGIRGNVDRSRLMDGFSLSALAM